MTTKYYPVESAIFLRATGKDATRYLHNRLSNDIKGLALGKTCRAAALSPQGRPEAFVTVIKEPESYLIIADGGEQSSISQAILRYKVADRIELNPVALKLWHIISPGNLSTLLTEQGASTISSGRSSNGLDVISETIPAQLTAAEKVSREEAEIFRISAKWPIFPAEINSDSMLLELGLNDAVSFNKGCYVGQEVLERVDSQGRPPRLLYVVRILKNTLPQTAAITDQAGKTIGELLTTVLDVKTNTVLGFALIKSGLQLKIGDSFLSDSATGRIER